MSIIRNSATAFLPQVVGIVFGIGTSIVTARVLGPAGRGVLTVALLSVVVMLLLSDAGMNSSLSYHVSKKRVGAAEALGISAYAAMSLGAVAIGVSLLLWPLLADNVLAGVDARLFFTAIAALPAMLLANMWVRVQMALDRFAVAVRYQIAVSAATFISAVAVFVVAGGGLHAYVLALTVMYWVVALCLFGMTVRECGSRLIIPRDTVRSVASFAARAYGGGVVNYALLRVDTFVLNAYSGSSAVGYYAMATTLMEKVWLIDTAASQAALPQVVAREREDAARLVAAVARNIIVLVGSAALALAFLAPWLIRLMYGAAFLPAAGALRILMPGVVAFALSRILFQYHAAHLARPGTVSAIRGLMAAIGIALYFVIIPRYGMNGAAATTTSIYVASFIVALTMFHRASGVPLGEILIPRREDIRRYVRVVRAFVRRVWARSGRTPAKSASHVDVASPGSTHVLVLCGGRGERWGDYLGVPKHLVSIEGEVLLDRTLRQLRECMPEGTRVFVVANDDAYAREGVEVYRAKIDESRGDADKFMSSAELWSPHGRTVVLFGDVWHSDCAMRTVLGFRGQEWTVFGRDGASLVTGKPWGELFAQSFYPPDLERHAECLEIIAEGYRRGEYEGQAGWREYRTMIGVPPQGPHVIRGRFIEIDDFTDDFDLPSEYDAWLGRRARLRSPGRIDFDLGSRQPDSVLIELTGAAADLIARESAGGVVRRDLTEVRDRLVRRLLRTRRPDDFNERVVLDARDGRLVVLESTD